MPRPPRPTARTLLTVAALACLACTACTGEPATLRWQLTFGEGAPSSRAVLVELRILRGGCDGSSEVFRGSIRPRSPAEMLEPFEG